jgi:hypothetical protein
MTSQVGGAPVSFTRATARSVIDHEVKVRNILSTEVPFYGLRRVYNRAGNSVFAGTLGVGNTPTGWAHSSATGTWELVASSFAGHQADKQTAVAERPYIGVGAGYTAVVGDVIVLSMDVEAIAAAPAGRVMSVVGVTATVIGTECLGTELVVGRRASAAFMVTVGGVLQGRFGVGVDGNDTGGITISRPQVEVVTGQSNQNPSEYVSVGADKLNYLINTDDLTLWAVGGTTPTPVRNGYLGGHIAWDLTDNNAATFENVAASITVPNDTSTWYFRHFLKKTTGGTAPIPAINFAFSGGGVAVSNNIRINPDTGAIVAQGAGGITTVTDRGDYWDILISCVNNASGHTALALTMFPAAKVPAGGVDDVVAVGTNTFAAPHITRGTAPAAYFPVGNVYPFHGAGVDGVKYFPYENGNTVTSNVVTEATGAAIPRTGMANAWLPGIAQSCFSTPNSAALNVAVPDLRVELVAEDWTASDNQALIGKWDDTANNRSFLMRVQVGTANLILNWWDGANNRQVQSTVALSAVDGTVAAARATLLPDNGSGGHTVTFYTAPSIAGPWTQLGATGSAGAFTTSVASSTALVTVGAYTGAGMPTGNLAPVKGTIRRAQIYSGIDGTKVLDFNPADGFTENRLVNSKMEGGAAAPTGWNQPVATGTSAVDSTLASGDVVYTQTGVAQRPFINQVSNVEAGVNYRFMAYIHENTGLPLNQILTPNPVAAGGTLLYSDGTAGGATVVATGWVWVDVIGGTASAATGWRIGVGTGSNSTGTLKFSRPQVRRLSISPTTPLDNVYIQSATAAARLGWDSAATGEQWSANGGAMVNRQPTGFMPDVASQNIALQSEALSTTWTANAGLLVTASSKRLGDIPFFILDDPNAAGQSFAGQNITFTGDAVKAFSLYVAQGTATSSFVGLFDNVAAAYRVLAVLTWTNGLPVVTMTTGTLLGIDYMGNGIFRLRFASTAVTAANAHAMRIYPANSGAGVNADVGTLIASGVQPENATTASSYIPTTTAAVTRNADQMAITSLGSWFNAAEGTVAVSIYGTPTNGAFVDIQDATANERLVTQANLGGGSYIVTDNTVNQVVLAGAAMNEASKIATCYKLNDFELYTNGTRAGTGDQGGTLPTVNQMLLGYRVSAPTTSQAQVPMQGFAYTPKRLTNAQLAALSP